MTLLWLTNPKARGVGVRLLRRQGRAMNIRGLSRTTLLTTSTATKNPASTTSSTASTRSFYPTDASRYPPPSKNEPYEPESPKTVVLLKYKCWFFFGFPPLRRGNTTPTTNKPSETKQKTVKYTVEGDSGFVADVTYELRRPFGAYPTPPSGAFKVYSSFFFCIFLPTIIPS